MAAPIILKSTDGGAPTLSGQDATLYDVLKWALPQFGWTIEFDNTTDKIVFRNDDVDGSGTYLRVNDLASAHPSTAQVAQVHAYVTMSDIDTGTGRTLNQDNCFIAKSSAANSTARRYEIWGDKHRFVFAAWTNTDSDHTRIVYSMFGDLVGRNPAEIPFIVRTPNAAPNNVYSAAQQLALAYNTGNSLGNTFTLSHDGVSTSVAGGLFGLAFHSNTGGAVGNNTTPGTVDPSTGRPQFCRAYFMDATRVRGYFPGVYWPIGSWYAVHGGYEEIPDCETPEGIRNLKFIASSISVAGASNNFGMLIDEEGGWDGD